MLTFTPSDLMHLLRAGQWPHHASRGTYNRQDPTAFYRVEAFVLLEQDWTPRETRLYRVFLNDVTWGVKVEVTWLPTRGRRSPRPKIDWYWDRDAPRGRPLSQAQQDLLRDLLLSGRWHCDLASAQRALAAEECHDAA